MRPVAKRLGCFVIPLYIIAMVHLHTHTYFYITFLYRSIFRRSSLPSPSRFLSARVSHGGISAGKNLFSCRRCRFPLCVPRLRFILFPRSLLDVGSTKPVLTVIIFRATDGNRVRLLIIGVVRF